MKICPGSHEEVVWSYIGLAKCSACKVFVGYKSVEEVDGWVDVARRHFPGGLRVATGSRGAYQFKVVSA